MGVNPCSNGLGMVGGGGGGGVESQCRMSNLKNDRVT